MNMQNKSQTFTIKGMRQDLSKGIFDSNYAFEIKNMRLTTREGNTLLSLTNERGNIEIAISGIDNIVGEILGWCVLNNIIVLFTKEGVGEIGTDYIYKIVIEDQLNTGSIIYSGNLNFSTNNPIESIGVYENEKIQKVYFVDGRNQPRVINLDTIYTNSDAFNFSNSIALDHEIEIEKINGGGIFPAGVIQYAFSYFNLNGQETNIFETTPLYYLSPKDRGLSPEETASCSFKITLRNLDTHFKFVRVYSIVRTSLNGTPVVKRVTDIQFNSTQDVIFTDTGTDGNNVDPQQLLYTGGESIIAGTMAHKDNTLFLGNIKINRDNIGTLDVNGVQLKNKVRQLSVTANRRWPDTNAIEGDFTKSFYDYRINNNLPSTSKRFFKYKEWYRLGFIAQHKNGKWSEAVFIKDVQNNLPSGLYPLSNGSGFAIGVGNFKVDLTSIKDTLKAAGYLRVAPVVVLPSAYDRSVIAQGIVCPTVYNVLDRSKGVPFAQSSWFSRVPKYTSYIHDTSLSNNGKRTGEIQLTMDELETPYMYITEPDSKYMTSSEFIGNYAENYFIDQSILTFHSPEIEVGEDVLQGSLDGVKFRIIGYASFPVVRADIDVTTSSAGLDSKNSEFIKSTLRAPYWGNPKIESYFISSDLWVDKSITDFVYKSKNDYMVGFVIYPWQRSGSLNNDTKEQADTDKRPRSAILERKKMSNLLYGTTTYESSWTASITTPQIFNSDSLMTVKIPSPKNSGLPSLSYYGNIDRLLMPNLVNMSDKSLEKTRFSTRSYNEGIDKSKGYTQFYGFYRYVGTDNTQKNIPNNYYYKSNIELSGTFPYHPFLETNTYGDVNILSSGIDPVLIRYKSSPHAVFALDYDINGNQIILPKGAEVSSFQYGALPFWRNDNKSPYSFITDNNVNKPDDALWVAEFYKDIDPSIRFGGTTNQAIQNNQWLVSGKAVYLGDGDETVEIEYLEGDTYFARFDNLKTYPFTMEDPNSVVEIMSTYVESRINLDLRYDRNRGNASNLVVTPNIFNLFNKVYDQPNNYFSYRALDYERFNLDTFYNSITWTLEKAPASQTDPWTTLTLANTLDLDGDKGQITSLNVFNNEIYCFQERGLSNILFNSRVQIPASDGVPIEISNGLKVGGKRYISNSIGCYNKSSIAETPSGIYFMDNITNSIYIFNGQQISSISDTKGFRQWVSDHNNLKKWDPINFDNFITFYDNNNNDVYFTLKDTSLCYSELLQEFTGFMSYEKTPAMFNVDSEFYTIKNGKLWKQFSGDYNMYYGAFQPYSITYIANGGGSLQDRIFNYVEFKTDVTDKNNNYLPTHTFDLLEVNTEYQHGTQVLIDKLGNPSNLKKKFNLWRAQIPRDIANGRDRIRNPWCYIKLERMYKDINKMNVHNVTVFYNE